MNEPTPTTGRDPATIDELISASLDGLLDEAAADLGIPNAEARALVAENPDRAAALSGARDLIAEPSHLDEVTRRRLVSAALSARRPLHGTKTTRRHRMMASAAGIAAGLLLLAGIGALFAGLSGRDSGDQSTGRVARGTTDETAAALGAEADFGEVSDPAVLRHRLRKVRAPAPAATESETAQRRTGTDQQYDPVPSEPRTGEPAVGDAPATTAGAEALGGTSGRAGFDAASGSVDCVTPLAAELEGVGVPVLVATATFEDAPAGVLVLSDGDSLTAVVYSAVDCAILATQSLATP